jgi:hypothetical protein
LRGSRWPSASSRTLPSRLLRLEGLTFSVSPPISPLQLLRLEGLTGSSSSWMAQVLDNYITFSHCYNYFNFYIVYVDYFQ